MSTPAIALVTDAALAIGDPNNQRVTLAQWNSIYNRSLRELCQKANVLKFRSVFALEPTAAYSYPPEMTVMTGMEATETPADDESFRTLGELFTDEFRAETSTRYPVATIPGRYHPTSNWFYFVPRPQAEILGGGRITYYGLPDRVVDEAALAVANLQTADFTQDLVTRRMIVYGMQARNRLVEARAEMELWDADVQTLVDRLDDRSQDRPSTIAPRRNRFAGMR